MADHHADQEAAGAAGPDAAGGADVRSHEIRFRRPASPRALTFLADSGGTPEVILIGTGSEVQLCVGAYEKLTAEGVKARVVSMPCFKLFEQQPAEYKLKVLPRGGARPRRR